MRALAGLYHESRAGRTGSADRDFQVDRRTLLAVAGVDRDDDALAAAMRDLEDSERRGLLRLDRLRHDASRVQKVRLPLDREDAFFEFLGEPTPSALRHRLATMFRAAVEAPPGGAWAREWTEYFLNLASRAALGDSVEPFARRDFAENAELVDVALRVLQWRGESPIRIVSCEICGDSKRLEALRPRVEAVLRDLTGGQVQDLERLGILPVPRKVTGSGPIRLLLDGEWLDLGLLQGVWCLSGLDIERATELQTGSSRCVTVENETSFHALTQLRSGDLLVCTSYAGSATRALLSRLPPGMECYHFGDSDPEGFDILRDLRVRTGRAFRPLHMGARAAVAGQEIPLTAADRKRLEKLIADPVMAEEAGTLRGLLDQGCLGAYEQESLGRPKLPRFPYY